MKEFMQRARKRPFLLDARVVVGSIGLFLSIALHELLHIILHWGNITMIGLFPSSGTIMQEIVVVPQGYNVGLEEAAAYTITMVTMITTIIVVWHIHDAKSLSKQPPHRDELSQLIEFAHSHGLLGKNV